MTREQLRRAAAGTLAWALLLTGCGGTEEAARTPDEVLAAAKRNLDETSGVHVVLSTDELPPGVSGILRADGVGTHPPAFRGTLQVVAAGITADAEVIAVDGTVHAKLPFTTEFTEVDPADYGAPDPAALMRPEGGLSSLLTAVEGVEKGEPQRDGDLVLTTYTGTVPGEIVAGIIPSASASSGFDAELTVTDDDQLRRVDLTGPFYPEAQDVTYTIEFDQYGISRDISAP